MTDNLALQVKVHGRVQGVYFRAFTTEHASQLHLTGYVRNADDGTVEVYAEGEKEALKQFLTILGTGPHGSRVTHVESQWSDFTGHYKDFRTIYRSFSL